MEKLKKYKEIIDKLIAEQDFSGNPKELYEPIAYTMGQNGKRLRPLLCMLSCDLFGGDLKKAEYPAIAAEVFHNFTLVHDDIMDEAPLRRGVETVYKKWNSNIAILVGDTMFAMAYQFAMKTDAELIPRILNVLSRVAREVCEGQQLDLNFETMDEVSINDYLEMIRLKTAVLLGASLEIGAVIARVDDKTLKLIYEFGTALGMAFQLQDDLLDVYGDTKVFGKITGGDIATNKKTYLYLKALETANKDEHDRLLELYSDKYQLNLEEKIAEVKQIFEKLKIKAVVENVMKDYYTQATDILNIIDVDQTKKKSLLDYVEFLYSRNV